MLHFLKREYESLFVHRFSSPTMPLLNIFKNSAHYHLLCGLNLAYWIYRPRNTPAPTIAFCVALWTFAQISNFLTHLALKNLRPQGSTQRKIPSGYGFDLVSCPNYFFEFLAWLSFSLLTRSWAAHLFLVVSTAQMYLWAAKKHQRYKTEFKHYPKSRKAMFPFIA
ncbi:putative enoyl reductase [Neolecta irregularis DAH-3]|uniref:Putative enoyl reductase n=1 Tax=Neolecta irregularis (strain DAH-3) TaxID=1198029 RepID=A0A1U7LHR4_NEOID|nr:putative enoyl reductase [Neolecta irregularis DAH-3]|eukprot:OLL22092.1 putative enoyl reductase [Neolecta irregularis DAH-3]